MDRHQVIIIQGFVRGLYTAIGVLKDLAGKEELAKEDQEFIRKLDIAAEAAKIWIRTKAQKLGS